MDAKSEPQTVDRGLSPGECCSEIGADDQDARDDLLACAAPLLWPMSGLIVVAVATLIAWWPA